MKNTITLLSFFGLLSAYFFLSSNSSGALPVFTGGPAEQTCGISSCHNTQANLGNAVASINFDTNQTSYEFGTSYPVSIRIDDAKNVARNGFEIVALDNNNNSLGSWKSLGTDVQEKSGSNGRSYLTHTLSGSTQTTWDFEWESPNSGATEVTFYLAALDCNNNGNKVGDDLYVLSKTIMGPSSSIEETPLEQAFTLSPNPVVDQLQILEEDQSKTIKSISLLNSNGKRLMMRQSVNTLDLGHLTAGLYFLIITDSAGKNVTKKLLKI